MSRRIQHRPEEALHKAVAELLEAALPVNAIWWHTPNQRGTRKRWEAALLKGLGVRAGIPDIFVLWRGRLYGIELKAGNGKLTDIQTAVHKWLTMAGATCTVCRSVEDVSLFLAMMMGTEWRASVGGQAA